MKNNSSVNKNIDSLLIQSVILLSRQYLLIDNLVNSQSCLKEFEHAIKENKQELSHVLSVYNYVFALIDNMERYQKIACSIPKINKKTIEFRRLKDSLTVSRNRRNDIQHIDENIENNYTGPLLGSICWISNDKQFITSFPDIGRDRSSFGIAFDTHTGKYMQDFCYMYNDEIYDLNKAIKGIQAFNEYIGTLVTIKIDGKFYDDKSNFTAMCIDYSSPS